MNAFDVIATIPAKSVDWQALRQATRDLYVAAYGEMDPTLSLRRYDAAQGLREIRFEIGCFANAIVNHRCETTVSRFIPPSPETLAWGGFLSGETVSYTKRDDEKEADAISEIAAIIARFRKGRNS